MTPKVLIATRSFGSTSPEPGEILHKGGCDLVNADMSLEMTEERLIDLLKGVAAAIVGVVPMTAYVHSVPKELPEIQLVSFENIIRLADFVSLHAPLNDDTRNIIGPAELAAMKPGAYLINTARGGLVDEQALFNALSTGKIAGAAFDCFVEEPLTGSPLLDLDNFVGTPHIGAHTQESIERVGVVAAQNVINSLKGQEPLYRVR